MCSESNVSLFVTNEPCLVVSSLDSKETRRFPKAVIFAGGLYFHEVCDKLGPITPESLAMLRGLPLAGAPSSCSSVKCPFCSLALPPPVIQDSKHQVFANGTLGDADIIMPMPDKLGATVIPAQDHGHYTRPSLPGTGKPVIQPSRLKSPSRHHDNKSARQSTDVLTSPITGREWPPSPSPTN